ncbi:MAG: hypothetical protein ACPGJS_19230 [Flammeovirgaceae bacterium]
MIEKIQIIHPEYFIRYQYTSDNSFEKHFYITFGLHLVGKKDIGLLWRWLIGNNGAKEYNEYIQHTFYMKRVRWYNDNGSPTSVDEAVALNVVKDYIDSIALTISEKEKKLRSQCKGKMGDQRPKTVHINELNWAA